MTDLLCNSLLAQIQSAYALVTPALMIEKHSPLFNNFCLEAEDPRTTPVCDLVPEFVGLENTFREVLKKGKTFDLPLINKAGNSYHCLVSPYDNPETPILVTFYNRTEFANLKQEILQRENEIRILKARLTAQSRNAASNLIGKSPALQKIKLMVERLSGIKATAILLQGETGTGKSTVARVLHYASAAEKDPFIEINCAALPETLLESELFGAVKGAYTNALQDRTGLIEAADGGSLFLDEISELPLALQAKLLSFLETRRFRPLGSNREKSVDIRLIAATNKDLEKEVEKGAFREDLFFRLNIVPLHLPALREMDEDVILLAEHFIRHFNLQFNKRIKGLSPAAKRKLLKHSWPGNVRELSNCMEQAMIFKDHGWLEAEDIALRRTEPEANISLPATGLNLETLERNLLLEALERAGGNKTQAARLLGLTRDTLRYRLEKHGIA
ncbi:MAG TPA: AAA family ATPase [Caldithrix abyssi]|uniref:AAA family ATPase n=1 Tax=Caldithrix abyssi TaxID=187145 RepID=A0A7V5RMZ8_CALAY|nr:AAA family ATPase [Caldithrix abyssi]